MASNVTAKDKKQIKVLGIIVAALLVVLVVVLALRRSSTRKSRWLHWP